MSTAVLVSHRPLSGQCQRVLSVLVERGSITARDAVNMEPPIYRLAARILELRAAFGDDAVVTVDEKHEGGIHARYVWRGAGDTQQELSL